MKGNRLKEKCLDEIRAIMAHIGPQVALRSSSRSHHADSNFSDSNEETRRSIKRYSWRSILFAASVLVVLAGVATATSIFFSFSQGPTQVEEPVMGDPMTAETWADPLYPNGGTAKSFSLTNHNTSENYTVKIVLESYRDIDGVEYTDPQAAALAASSAEHSAFISNVSIDGKNGHEVDLLNDGVAYYHTLPAETTQTGQIVLDAHEDLESYGTVSMNVTFYRVNDVQENRAVQIHESRNDTCAASTCHATSNSEAIHDEMDTGSDCEACHGRTMEDLHMSCVAGCHDSYPIRHVNESSGSEYPHGPNTVMETDLGTGRGAVADYYCGENCHGTQIGSSHTFVLEADYCGQCHDEANATIWDFHQNLSRNCIGCHGKTSEAIHSHYDVTASNNQCARCHGSALG